MHQSRTIKMRTVSILLLALLVPLAVWLALTALPRFDRTAQETATVEAASRDSGITANTLQPAQEHNPVAGGLRSAVVAACMGEPPDFNDYALISVDTWMRMRPTLARNLSVSFTAEHLHFAALITDDPARRIELLHRAVSISPGDPFLAWAAVRLCTEHKELGDCMLQDLEQRLVAIDGQNSEAWIRIAANRYAAGDVDAALDAMRRASTAAESRDYWTETIEMIERGLAAGSNLAFPQRATMAVGIAAAEQPGYGDYVTMCREQSAQSVDWAHLCLAYGELAAQQVKTEMGVSIARAIQKLALESLGEVEKADTVDRQIQARRAERISGMTNHHLAVHRIVFSNPTLYSAYLAAIRDEGEAAARASIAEEVERLVRLRPGLTCASN